MASSWVPSGNSIPIDKPNNNQEEIVGVNAPALSPDINGEGANGSNACLEIEGNDSSIQRLYLWVNNVESAFTVSGSVAQSVARRQFFPRDFAQPALMISGQTPNQYEYGRIAEFVRQSHLNVINPSFGGTGLGLVTLTVFTDQKPTKFPMVKGPHQNLRIRGYVSSIERATERFVNAPDFKFEFIIAEATKFLGLQDQIQVGTELVSIVDALDQGRLTGPQRGSTHKEQTNERVEAVQYAEDAIENIVALLQQWTANEAGVGQIDPDDVFTDPLPTSSP